MTRKKRKLSHGGDINVTPMIDVMLVLVIFFIIAMPILQTSVDIELPKISTEGTKIESEHETLDIFIKTDALISINNQEIKIDEIGMAINTFTMGNKNKKIRLYGDKNITYGKVMVVLDEIKKNGYDKVMLIVEHKK